MRMHEDYWYMSPTTSVPITWKDSVLRTGLRPSRRRTDDRPIVQAIIGDLSSGNLVTVSCHREYFSSLVQSPKRWSRRIYQGVSQICLLLRLRLGRTRARYTSSWRDDGCMRYSDRTMNCLG